MNIRKTLESITLLTAVACASHDKAPTAPVRLETAISTSIERADGYGGDSLTVKGFAPIGSIYTRNGSPVAVVVHDTAFSYATTLSNSEEALHIAAPSGKTKDVVLAGKPLPLLPALAAADTAVELTPGVAPFPLALNPIPSGVTASLTQDGKSIPLQNQQLVVAIPASGATVPSTLALTGTVPGYNGQIRTLVPAQKTVYGRAARPQTINSGTNWTIEGFEGIYQAQLVPNTGDGPSTLSAVLGTKTFSGTTVVNFRYGPFTHPDSVVNVSLTPVHIATGRAAPQTATFLVYKLPAIQGTITGGTCALNLRSPAPTFHDVVAEQKLALIVESKSRGATIHSDTLDTINSTKTFACATQPDSFSYTVNLPNGAKQVYPTTNPYTVKP